MNKGIGARLRDSSKVQITFEVADMKFIRTFGHSQHRIILHLHITQKLTTRKNEVKCNVITNHDTDEDQEKNPQSWSLTAVCYFE